MVVCACVCVCASTCTHSAMNQPAAKQPTSQPTNQRTNRPTRLQRQQCTMYDRSSAALARFYWHCWWRWRCLFTFIKNISSLFFSLSFIFFLFYTIQAFIWTIECSQTHIYITHTHLDANISHWPSATSLNSLYLSLAYLKILTSRNGYHLKQLYSFIEFLIFFFLKFFFLISFLSLIS